MWTKDFALLLASAFLFQTGIHFLVPALPLFLESLGSGETVIGVVMGLGAFSALASRAAFSRSVDDWGRVRVLLGAAAVAAAGAGGLTIANDDLVVAPLRAVIAGAMALFLTASTTAAADLAPPSRRGEVMGWFGFAGPLAMAVGPGVGGFLLAAQGFTAVFAGSVVCALGAAALALPLRSSAAVGGTQEPAAGGAKAHRLVLVPAAVKPSLFILALILTNGAVFAFAPLRAAELGLGNVGAFFVAYAVMMLLARSLSGRLSDRVGRGAMVLPGLVVAAAGLLAIANSTSGIALVASGAVYGLGLGTASPALTAWVIDRVGADRRGAGVNTMLMAMDVGIGFGSAVVGFMISGLGFSSSFTLLSAIVGVAAALFVVVWIREHGRLLVSSSPG